MRDKTLLFKLLLMLLVAVGNWWFNRQTLFENDPLIYSHYSLINISIAMLSFGVILSAIFYNMALYFYGRDKRYLYYSLAQTSVVLFLASLDSLHIVPLNEIFTFRSYKLFDISQIAILLFFMLFIKHFLTLNQENKKLLTILHAIMILALIDLLCVLLFSHSVLTRFLPIFIPIWFVITEAKRLIPAKDKAFNILYYGWNMVIFVGFFVYTNLTTYFNMDFPYLHVTFALESIIFALAIAYKIKEMQEEKAMQQSLLLQQSRLASMGEMISIIAHQWRQPLTHLLYLCMNMKQKIKEPTFLAEKLEEGEDQIAYMSQTIEQFSNFYNPSKKRELFSIQDASQRALTIAGFSLKKQHIDVKFFCEEDFEQFGNRNEFEQVILNLLHNARDVLIEREIENPSIWLTIERAVVKIEDNAGGISAENMEKIFEPYFTTKERSDGIGLYIAKVIIEKEFSGSLSVKNSSRGALFEIRMRL